MWGQVFCLLAFSSILFYFIFLNFWLCYVIDVYTQSGIRRRESNFNLKSIRSPLQLARTSCQSDLSYY